MSAPSFTAAAKNPGRITVVLPFYNEENYLSDTLESLADQAVTPAKFLLVDNASTDRSVAICQEFQKRRPALPVLIVSEKRPGKINALETGLKYVETHFTAFCDADTYYPPHYFQLGLQLFEKYGDKLVGAMGVDITDAPDSPVGRRQRWKKSMAAALLAKQCHTGGFGHLFRTEPLKRTGGYSRDIWPYMQADHEIVHRMLKQGDCAYHRDLWCQPSQRRSNRARVSWTLFEIIVYHLTPFALKDWYFYKFLRGRFIRRDMMNTNLREQPWAQEEKPEI